MIVVVDANILVSALLGSRSIRPVLLRQDLLLCAPTVVVEEIERYRDEICSRAGITAAEFDRGLQGFLSCLRLIEAEVYAPVLPRARAAMTRDLGDAPYLACALALEGVIWTNDKDFASQTVVAVLSTADLERKPSGFSS